MLIDDEWDLKSHPYLDPKGENNLNAERKVPLRNVQYIEQRIKNVNPAYAKNHIHTVCLSELHRHETAYQPHQHECNEGNEACGGRHDQLRIR